MSSIKSKKRMECMEVWGGNASIDRSFAVSGLKIWLYSSAHGAGDYGGDVYYISSCASGRITRLLLADVTGHGSVAADMAVGLTELKERITDLNHENLLKDDSTALLFQADGSVPSMIDNLMAPYRYVRGSLNNTSIR